MSTSTYFADTHVFTSRSDNSIIRIIPGAGETLFIEGVTSGAAGDDQEVQFNDNGILAGDPTFVFDGTGLSVPAIYGTQDSDLEGYNEIYRGPGPQIVTSGYTLQLRYLGQDIGMARNVNYIAYAAPNYIPGNSYGGVSVFKETAGIFAETDYLSIMNFTLDADTTYCAINENADMICFPSKDDYCFMSTYSRSGVTWTGVDSFNEAYGVKLHSSGVGVARMLCYDLHSTFVIRNWTGGHNWNVIQTLYTSGAASGYNDWPMAFNPYAAIISYSNNIRIYIKATTYDLTYNFNVTNLTDMDNYGTIFCFIANGVLWIYESFVYITNITLANSTNCCTNGTYIFVSTSTNIIYIFSKILGVWTASYNTTTYTGSKRMACNATYLTVGAPLVGSNGQAAIYTIVPYTQTSLHLTTIDMLNPSNQIEIISPAGIFISSGSLTVTGDITLTNLTSSGTVTSGTTIANKISLTGNQTGTLTLSGTEVNLATNTYTSTSSGALTTISSMVINPTTYTNSTATTIANCSSLRIVSAPIAAGSLTITNNWALRVEAGNVLLGSGTITNTNTTTASSSSLGAMILSGGIAISKTTDANSTADGGTFTTAGGMAVAKKLYVGSYIVSVQPFITVNSNGGSQSLGADTTTRLNSVYWPAGSSSSSSVSPPTLSAGRFTIAVTGYYNISYSVGVTGNSGYSRAAFISINDSVTSPLYGYCTNLNSLDANHMNGSAVILLGIGDTVSIWVKVVSVATTTNTAVYGTFTAYKVC